MKWVGPTPKSGGYNSREISQLRGLPHEKLGGKLSLNIMPGFPTYSTRAGKSSPSGCENKWEFYPPGRNRVS